MRNWAIPLACLSAASLIFTADISAAVAQRVADRTAALDGTTRSTGPAFYLNATLNRVDHLYRKGETVSVRLQCEVDAYIYVLYQQADGKVYKIFPNRFQRENHVAANRHFAIPGSSDFFTWTVGPPYGMERIRVLAARQRIESLENDQAMQPLFDTIDDNDIRQAVAELASVDRDQWSDVDVQLTTYGTGEPNRQRRDRNSDAQRFGVFFGVAEYQFDDKLQTSLRRHKSEDVDSMNLRAPAKDAQLASAAIADIAQHQVFVNEQATKETMRRAITEWLPSTTRPGDTVFIYFSGHGGKISDDNRDEDDRQDEYLTTYDLVNWPIMDQLVYEENSLSESLRSQIEPLRNLYSRNASRESNDALLRASCITDDLFGRWLQKLKGRRVIVILDACNSGGFATSEVDAPPVEEKSLSFDFLGSEVTRLKGIGETDQALLSSSYSSQLSLEMPGGGISLYTYAMIESLRHQRGPVTLEQNFAGSKSVMREWFLELNQRRKKKGLKPVDPHQPVLMNHCTSAVYIRP